MTIGICGCDRGCGVTHLAIALSNYCASKLRMSTACLELNDTHALRKLTAFSAGTKPKKNTDYKSSQLHIRRCQPGGTSPA